MARGHPKIHFGRHTKAAKQPRAVRGPKGHRPPPKRGPDGRFIKKAP